MPGGFCTCAEKGALFMPNESDKRLADAAVARGVLSPAQANFALRALKTAEASGALGSLREVILKNRLVSPRRWDEFEGALAVKAAPGLDSSPNLPTLPAPAKPSDLALPFEIGGYRLTKKIGQGGMGVVYKAVQLAMRREVAIKILAAPLAADPDFVESFRLEARAAGALNHPNVIVPIDVGEERGFHFLAMEYIDGASLAAWMEREGRLPWREAVEIARQVARGLEHAHKLGLVHRDIKPDNILIDRPSGLAKIADLGLARRKGDCASQELDGQAVGTPYYIAPEQARAEKSIDGRADIYSLGATLWHLIAGVPPFEGPTSAVIMTKHLTEFVPDPRTAVADCPEDLVAVIFMMMAKDRFDRYADCGALIADLEHLLKGKPVRAPKPPRRGARDRGGMPLAIPGGRSGPAGSRLRELTGSRHANPSASRLREGSLSRARDGLGGHGLRRKHPAPLVPWAVLAVLALLTPIVLALLLQSDPGEKPAPPAEHPAPAKSAASVEPRVLAPTGEEREAEARKDLREAERFAKGIALPFDQAPAIARYERVIRTYPNTQAAREAQTQVEALRVALKALPAPR